VCNKIIVAGEMN